MKSGTQMAMAVGAGYLLGRRRKAKLGVLVTAAAAAGATGGVAGRLLRKGTGMLTSSEVLGKISPELGEITDLIRGDLLDAGRGAAANAVSSRIGSLGDRLRDRTDALRNIAGDEQEAAADDEGENGGRPRSAGVPAGAGNGEREDGESRAAGNGRASGRATRRAIGDGTGASAPRARRGRAARPAGDDGPAEARRGRTGGSASSRTTASAQAVPARSSRAASPVRRTGR